MKKLILLLISIVVMSCSIQEEENINDSNTSIYDGNYKGDYQGSDSGVWKLNISEGIVKGKLYSNKYSSNGHYVIIGDVKNDQITFLVKADTPVNFIGKLKNNSLSGTWEGNSLSGTWEGNKIQ